MNVDQPSAGSVSTRNEVNAKAAKTTTKNQSLGRAERGRGAMLGANSTAKAKMLFGLAFEGPRSVQSSGAFLHPWTTHRPRFRSPRAAARDAARRPLPAHGDPWRFGRHHSLSSAFRPRPTSSGTRPRSPPGGKREWRRSFPESDRPRARGSQSKR